MKFAEKWVDMEKNILSEVNQTPKDKCCVFYFLRRV